MDVAAQIEVQRLALADERRAIGGELDDPALVDLERRAEHRLLVVGQRLEMLHRALVREDRLPRVLGIQPLRAQHLLQRRIAHAERARQRLVRVDVGRDRLDAGAGAAADHRDAGGGRDRELVREALQHAAFGGVGAGAAFFGECARRRVGLAPQMLEHAQVGGARQRALERNAVVLQPGMKAHGAEAHRALAHRRILRRVHRSRRVVDELLQHVVQHAQYVFDEARLRAPLLPGLEVHRRQAAHRGAGAAQVVDAGGQQDLAAQVRLAHLEPEFALMWRELVVGRVAEQQIRLAGLQPRLENLLPQVARRQRAQLRAVLRAAQRKRQIVAHRLHEFVGDADAMVQVQALAIEVARRFADLDELLDLRMMHIEIHGGRSAAQRALRDRKRQRIHDAHERNDSRGLAAALHGLADGAHAAPVGADAAAVRREPHVFRPGADDAVEIVFDRVQEAGDRQAARGAAVRQDGRGGQEPQPRHVVVQPLRVRAVIGVGARHAREQILRGFAREQVAILQRGAAEVRQQRVASRNRS